ncbi:uncharacterized protein LOC116843465 isoform X1 [Odontomachus brunneus]|uniref:uncharacterized protein LOC116843465 isoform X1 n=1 Tax=Odontomachus brunneus TaxID=486640 RepID=UPI0013F1B1E8|nr:uncharacterized protein LOC116843465 isoform X1 [Odontomachus brunneus]
MNLKIARGYIKRGVLHFQLSSTLAALLIYRFSILSSTWMYHDVLSKKANSNIAEILHRPIRELAFSENSNMGLRVFRTRLPTESNLRDLGISATAQRSDRRHRARAFHIFFAVGIPVDIPDKSIAVSFYFEANYGLPWNSSYYHEENYFTKRSLDRQLVYRASIKKLESLGYPGLDCLLRIICEAAKYPLSENGVLGDILQIVFTPSSSRDENLPNEIIEAEREQHCDRRYKKCPVNPFDLVSNHVGAT